MHFRTGIWQLPLCFAHFCLNRYEESEHRERMKMDKKVDWKKTNSKGITIDRNLSHSRGLAMSVIWGWSWVVGRGGAWVILRDSDQNTSSFPKTRETPFLGTISRGSLVQSSLSLAVMPTNFAVMDESLLHFLLQQNWHHLPPQPCEELKAADSLYTVFQRLNYLNKHQAVVFYQNSLAPYGGAKKTETLHRKWKIIRTFPW